MIIPEVRCLGVKGSMKPFFVTASILLGGCWPGLASAYSEAPKPSQETRSGFHLEHRQWSGTSPGAGFTHTSLSVVQLDLVRGKKRRIVKSARRPDPMLPHDDDGIARILEDVPWRELSDTEIQKYDQLIQAWIATNPPATYNEPMTLGREDGYLSQLVVSWGTKSVTTRLNVRGGFSSDDPLRPPQEWRALLDALHGTTGHGALLLGGSNDVVGKEEAISLAISAIQQPLAERARQDGRAVPRIEDFATDARDWAEDPSKWVVAWDFNPAGGGYHAHVLIDKTTGEVVDIQIGWHGR